ncbi:MAG: hypothetical protein WC661_07960 [Opitutaceae bacterium]
MNSLTSSPSSSIQSSVSEEPFTPFHWLLVLGFPPSLAAHVLAPDTFQADDV